MAHFCHPQQGITNISTNDHVSAKSTVYVCSVNDALSFDMSHASL